jgi:hypothetical protein
MFGIIPFLQQVAGFCIASKGEGAGPAGSAASQL